MRMTLIRKSDYAVRAMLDISMHHPARRTARSVGSATEIPRNTLTQVLATLVAQGLLDSVAGPAGGYTLTRPPEDITLLEVITAAEGPIRDESCALTGGTCDANHACAIHDLWRRATDDFTRHLATTTLANLVADGSHPG